MKSNCLVVSGFLEAGKTTYINQYLVGKKHRVLILSCEYGEVEYNTFSNVVIKKVQLNQLNESLFDLDMFDEIIIEYNGTWDPKYLLELDIFKEVKLKWVHLIDGYTYDFYIRNLFDLMSSQIVNSDEVLITKSNNKKEILNQIKVLNPKIEKGNYLWIGIMLIALILVFKRDELSKLITIFSSILIQAVPFLLLGVFVSTWVQFYISEYTIERILKKYPRFLGYPIAILLSGFLPVCDCAMVPIATRFAQKKVPISQVITFLLASTSLNPLVLISTYFAFASFEAVFHRIIVTLVITIVVSIYFSFFSKKQFLLKEGLSIFTCSSGYIGVSDNKIELLLRHAGLEFIRLMKYVFVGSFLSTIIQVMIQESQINISNPILLFGMLVVFSIFISVCSTSNAFLARSLNVNLPYWFSVLFMCLGPMLDIKNLLLLKNGFNKKFLIHYIVSIIVVAVLFVIVVIYL